MGTDKDKGGRAKKAGGNGAPDGDWGMKATEFFALEQTVAGEQGEALLALWHEARGNWGQAHALAQEAGEAAEPEEARAGAWVHAYLHRVEGDEGNAGYWYARAGRRAPARGTSLAEERNAIATELLAKR